MKRVPAVLAAFYFLTVLTFAQAPMLTPTPRPEQQKIGYFIGDWKLAGTLKVAPNVPAGPFTSTEHAAWVEGQFFVETHSSMNFN